MIEYVRKKGTRELSEVAAGHGTSVQVLIGSEEAPNFAFRKFVVAPHGGMPKHTNLVDHEQYVLRGSGIIEIAGESFEVSEGDSVYIPNQVICNPLHYLCFSPSNRSQFFINIIILRLFLVIIYS
jgi:quercetin dioxygenase-like cupin family protein